MSHETISDLILNTLKSYNDDISLHLLKHDIKCMSNYEDVLRTFFTTLPLDVLNLMLTKIDYINPTHLKYHQEPYGWHLLCVGHITYHYLKSDEGFLLGFCHDMGKFALGENTFLHGQISVHMSENGIKCPIIKLLIDQHMSVCTHCHQSTDDISYEIWNIIRKTLPISDVDKFDKYYKALVIADSLGKKKYNDTDTNALNDTNIVNDTNNLNTLSEMETFSNKSLNNIVLFNTHNPISNLQTNTSRIILLMIGTPGTGKSYSSKIIKDQYESNGKSVKIIERDIAFYRQALADGLIENISYDEFIYGGIYKIHYETLKKKVQTIFEDEIVETFDEKYDIIIIDSCITLNLNKVNDMLSGVSLSPNDVILGYIGFPQIQLGRSGSSKLNDDNQVRWPLVDQHFYRGKNEIKMDDRSKNNIQPVFISAIPSLLVSVGLNILSTYNPCNTFIHTHPVQLSYEVLMNNTSPFGTSRTITRDNPIIFKIYKFNEQDSNISNLEVLRLTYNDGQQRPVIIDDKVVTDYRGEYLIYVNNKLYKLRRSFPIFPESRQENIYKYSHSFAYDRVNNKNNNVSVYAQPKYDGSLNVICIVRKNTIQSLAMKYMSSTLSENNKWTYYTDHPLYDVAIGSKTALFIGSDNCECMIVPIIDAYGSISAFVNANIEYIDDIWNDTISTMWENVPCSIDKEEVGRVRLLTIHSSKSHMYYLGNISQNGIVLSKDNSIKIEEDINEWFQNEIKKAYNGENMNLEGYVLTFIDNHSSRSVQIKYKFPWYYTAHKPIMYINEARNILTNPLYDNIRKYLIFSYTPTKINNEKELIADLYNMYKNLYSSCENKSMKDIVPIVDTYIATNSIQIDKLLGYINRTTKKKYAFRNYLRLHKLFPMTIDDLYKVVYDTK